MKTKEEPSKLKNDFETISKEELKKQFVNELSEEELDRVSGGDTVPDLCDDKRLC